MIQFGLLLLIATPIASVAFSVAYLRSSATGCISGSRLSVLAVLDLELVRIGIRAALASRHSYAELGHDLAGSGDLQPPGIASRYSAPWPTVRAPRCVFMKATTMNGAECLLRTLLANSVDTCFMNPGTSEMQFVSALDRVPEMRARAVSFRRRLFRRGGRLCRMTGKPAATLLHLGPGLANALSNLHNARKALSPVVNIVGEHSTAHLKHDAPLTSDIEEFARPVSAWVRTLERASAMGEAASAAVAPHRTAGKSRDPDRARGLLLERSRRARLSRAPLGEAAA